jgi:YggT family protein
MIYLINLLYNILFILILARIVLSFTQSGYYHPVGRAIFNVTEPLLAPIRAILPPMGGFDFSPIVLLLAAGLLRSILTSLAIA